MTDQSETTELETRGQPREILARMRPAFRQHVRPHTENQEGERLGGGSMLSAQWAHRLSLDMDVYLRLATKEDARKILDRAASACNGYRIEHPTFRRIEFERNRDNHVDVTLTAPIPAKGEQPRIVDGEEALVLSNAQIMCGKLQGRGLTAPTRDLFDIAVCEMADPEALEVAVNALEDARIEAVLTVYRATEAQYRRDGPLLDGVPESLRPLAEDPAAYANNAILRRKYDEVAIRTEGGRATVIARTREGAVRTRTFDSAEALQDGMERHGVNAFLKAQYRDCKAVADDTIDGMWMNRAETIIEVWTERPNHPIRSVPAVHWRLPMRQSG